MTPTDAHMVVITAGSAAVLCSAVAVFHLVKTKPIMEEPGEIEEESDFQSTVQTNINGNTPQHAVTTTSTSTAASFNHTATKPNNETKLNIWHLLKSTLFHVFHIQRPPNQPHSRSTSLPHFLHSSSQRTISWAWNEKQKGKIAEPDVESSIISINTVELRAFGGLDVGSDDTRPSPFQYYDVEDDVFESSRKRTVYLQNPKADDIASKRVKEGILELSDAVEWLHIQAGLTVNE